MAKYIEREALLKDIEEERPENWTDSEAERQAENDFYKYRGIVEIQPTADVVEVKQGYWEEYWDDDYMESFHRCSECRNDAPAKRDTYCDQVLTNYCPNCGAKMDKKEGAENDL